MSYGAAAGNEPQDLLDYDNDDALSERQQEVSCRLLIYFWITVNRVLYTGHCTTVLNYEH